MRRTAEFAQIRWVLCWHVEYAPVFAGVCHLRRAIKA